MLVFIIPVLHPSKCHSYIRVSDTLNRTLHSICGQIDRAFKVIVVCNIRPVLEIIDTNIEIIEVNFPIPVFPTGLCDRYTHIYNDKGSKVAVGIANARKYHPTHLMIADHDDYVSNKLSLFVKENSEHPGWFFKEGYVYSCVSKIIAKRDNFQTYCGTSHIIRTDLLDNFNISPFEINYKILQDKIDPFYLQRILGNHNDYINYFNNMQKPLSPLPFIGSIWNVDNGDNSSQLVFRNKRTGPVWGGDITPLISKEFGISYCRRSLIEEMMLLYYRIKNIIGNIVKFKVARISRMQAALKISASMHK